MAKNNAHKSDRPKPNASIVRKRINMPQLVRASPSNQNGAIAHTELTSKYCDTLAWVYMNIKLSQNPQLNSHVPLNNSLPENIHVLDFYIQNIQHSRHDHKQPLQHVKITRPVT